MEADGLPEYPLSRIDESRARYFDLGSGPVFPQAAAYFGHEAVPAALTEPTETSPQLNCIPSPVDLTYVDGLPPESNVDTIKLSDILGDPAIIECWQFNHQFDIDFLMQQFDPFVRGVVAVNVIYGLDESSNRDHIEEACLRYPNVKAFGVDLPYSSSIHNSKMMILKDLHESMQIIIHTANMIPGDWKNMAQAVWRSPLLLPLLPTEHYDSSIIGTVGSGLRFKRDFLAYLSAYRVGISRPLIGLLKNYDFQSIRAALIASVPTSIIRFRARQAGVRWGIEAMRHLISEIPIYQQSPYDITPGIVAQTSSVTNYSRTQNWLGDIFFESLYSSSEINTPKFSIVYPTTDEVSGSLRGLASGRCIAIKISSICLDYFKSCLCRWTGAGSDRDNLDQKSGETSQPDKADRLAGRHRATPNLNTYIRFSDSKHMQAIDWAMVTSARLSPAGWGGRRRPFMSNWEIGVVVWPNLFIDQTGNDNGSETKSKEYSRMVPCFQRNTPSQSEIEQYVLEASSKDDTYQLESCTLVGFRMPYDLPLAPYAPRDKPWQGDPCFRKVDRSI
ncbi:hypothetical protein LOZ57_003135 [Ophidiomyces ophidiicola]|uniref:uncharacterized protein n=1 Tax=Ophidiomyces ophidiicola TaxID=1387563 RepID=UPI0020C448A1|nr:uncharacterized protein LOZ57_003135 [Ophidiomyces ophidiicola]KAI1947408.1 hypothetical protein LOZ57_003135 [Ophidiomyces ophidiicola]KAI2042922.1 hypothetical protein LOZ43_006728 [Ophidiomyces ophidiicola]